jgi:hypothetical protein
MDYLEGLFLGKLWSDTDFENRRHTALFVLYGIFVESLVLYGYVSGKPLPFVGDFTTTHLVLFGLLFVACPFICMRYYRMPAWGKALVMIEKMVKSFIVVGFTVDLIGSKITVGANDLQTFTIGYLNDTLEKYTKMFASSTGSFSTVIGVLVGGLHVLFVILLILFLAIVVPGIIYLLYRLLQFCYDWVINKLIIKRFIPIRK